MLLLTILVFTSIFLFLLCFDSNSDSIYDSNSSENQPLGVILKILTSTMPFTPGVTPTLGLV